MNTPAFPVLPFDHLLSPEAKARCEQEVLAWNLGGQRTDGVFAGSRAGLTPLHQACMEGNVSLVKQLLDLNADLDARDGQSRTPMDVASTETIRKLLREERAKRDRGAIFRLIESYDVHGLEKLLDKGGVNLNQEGEARYTGHLPIFDAVLCGDPQMVRLLIARGANPNKLKWEGESALFWALRMSTSGERVAQVLIEAGANPNLALKDGRTPLHFANARMTRQLLDAGANPHARDAKGHTALDKANSEGRHDVVEALLAFGDH